MNDAYLSFAIFEAIWLGLFLLVNHLARRRADGSVHNLVDRGPWWSVACNRLWLVCHLPVLILQLAINHFSQTFRNGKGYGLPISLLHAANYGLLLLCVDFTLH